MTGFRPLQKAFEDQFEQDGTGFLYRRYGRGPAIRVTEDEYHLFVEAFEQRGRFAFWGVIVAMLVMMGGLAAYATTPGAISPIVLMWGGMALFVGAFMAGHHWLHTAPQRVLEGRAPSRAALPKDEVRRRLFSQLSYVQLGLVVAVALFLLLKQWMRHDLLHGWSRLWFVLAGALILLAAVQAVRKWRYDRANPKRDAP